MCTITIHDDGFEIAARRGESMCIRWAEIQEIFGFKLDLGIYDAIRLGFRLVGAESCYDVDEDWPGFKDLRTEVKRRFDVDEGWWSEVAFPAFATNHTTLWTIATGRRLT